MRLILRKGRLQILYSAIESLSVGDDNRSVIVRTVSGQVHILPANSEEHAKAVIESFIDNIAVTESL